MRSWSTIMRQCLPETGEPRSNWDKAFTALVSSLSQGHRVSMRCMMSALALACAGFCLFMTHRASVALTGDDNWLSHHDPDPMGRNPEFEATRVSAAFDGTVRRYRHILERDPTLEEMKVAISGLVSGQLCCGSTHTARFRSRF
jgi:hypothetical protein